ncbi:hypothetical protein MMC22_000772 [Lobaria immixta]|nr:hypothetical protein [Lobaria immixta]
MTSSDLEVLLDMGFEKSRAELAVKRTGGVQGAIEWLEENQDKTIEEIMAPAAGNETDPSIEPVAPAAGEEARSLVCHECGKKFKSKEQAEFHAQKTQHVDFAESTEEIAPLSAEEKKARLEELRQKLAEKRAGTSAQDKADQKRNEEIRRKSTKHTQDIKEDLKKKEQLKEAAAKRREKQEEIAAKKRIKAKITADKEERRQRTEKEKAEREGRALAVEPMAGQIPTNSGPVASKPASAYTEARLRLQTPGGNIQKSFPAETTLFEVASVLSQEAEIEVQSFTQNFPKKVFDAVDFGATLKELGLVPSASLIVR